MGQTRGVPDTVIEIAGHPLSDNVTGLVCFCKCLVVVDVDDFRQCLLLVYGILSYLTQPEKQSGPFKRLW